MPNESKAKSRLVAKLKGGVTDVKAKIIHPMETGLRKDKETDKIVPAHFIEDVIWKWNDRTVMTALWGGGVAKDPYVAIKIAGPAKGDSVSLTWTDNTGDSDTLTTQVK
jgi:sulfur-oxidizing protein SoxZ